MNDLKMKISAIRQFIFKNLKPSAEYSKIPFIARCYAVVGICCFVNFAIFGIYSFRHGGDALNGSVEDGKYYLSEHGNKTEVSEGVWRFSLAYTKVSLVLFGVGFFSFVIFGGYVESARYQAQKRK